MKRLTKYMKNENQQTRARTDYLLLINSNMLLLFVFYQINLISTSSYQIKTCS